MLTKSLHTVTAATNVARLLSQAGAPYTDGATLARAALDVLGYPDVSTSTEGCAADVTVARIVKACEAIVGA